VSPNLGHNISLTSHFAHFAFIVSFEPRDVGHALCDPIWVNAMHEELENFESNQSGFWYHLHKSVTP
jgi:hypothetical protein